MSRFRVCLALSIVAGLLGPGPLRAAPDRTLDALFAKLAQAGTPERAKPLEQEILGRFLASDSATVGLLMTRAAGLVAASDPHTAEKLLEAVTKIAPDYAEGWHQLAKLEMDSGRDEAALVGLQKTVKLNPREFEAIVDLGDMEMQYGAKAAALAQYRRALALDPHLEGLDRRVEALRREVEGEKI
jgi:tetratricopeptide (TPR) repeat protein